MSESKPKAAPKRRRVNRATANQDDLISQLEQGTGVSTRSKKILHEMQSKDADKKSEFHDEPLFNSGAFFDLVLIDYIRPQEDNPRYLPVKSSTGNNVDSSALDNCVVCDKGVLENRLSPSNPRYDEIEKEIESIKSLAETIKTNGLLQPITVWRGNTSNFPIIAGHRRYYAIVYLYGRMLKIRAKIYPEKPEKMHILRHVENFARIDLSPSDALRSYKAAINDLSDELASATTASIRFNIVTSTLGFSKSQYYRFEKLISYFGEVVELMDTGVLSSIDDVYVDIGKLEKEGGPDLVHEYLASVKASGIRLSVEEFLNARETIEVEKAKPKRGREKKFITLPKIKANQSNAIFRLLKEDVTLLDTGVDWDNLDKNDPKAMEEAMKSIIDLLCK